MATFSYLCIPTNKNPIFTADKESLKIFFIQGSILRPFKEIRIKFNLITKYYLYESGNRDQKKHLLDRSK